MLPTSFVPNEDQGYVMCAIIMPDAASLNRTADVSDRVDAIFAKIPAVDNRTEITGYSLLDSGFKTNAGTFFVTLKPFDERYGSTKAAKEENARAVLMGLRRESGHPAGTGHPDRAAGHPRHRHHGRLRILDPGHWGRRARHA